MLLFLLHPVVWVIHQAIAYQNAGLDASGWILLGIMVLPMWILIARIIAEIPGTRLGKMYLWWMIFIVFHLWGVAFYVLMEKFADGFSFKKRFAKRIELADRSEDEIMSSPFNPAGSALSTPSELTGLPLATPFSMSHLSSMPPFEDNPDITPFE